MKIMRFLFLLVAVILVPLTGRAEPVPPVASVVASSAADDRIQVNTLRWGKPEKDKLRVVVDLSGKAKFNYFILAGATPRLVVDVQKAAVNTQGKDTISLDGEIASQIRVNQNRPDVARIVVDLNDPLEEGSFEVFALAANPEADKPNRLVIDIARPELKPVDWKVKPGIKGKTIVLDAGHGGSDVGAVGANKTLEKTVTLAVTLELKTLLEKAGARVVLTRDNDRDVFGAGATDREELQARVDVGSRAKSDLFISIHADSAGSREAGGTTTYFFPKTTVDDELAESIQTSMVKTVGLQDRGVRKARFYVIRRTTMPAVLVELAFISNANEEKLLASKEFQNQSAKAIYQGIEQFFATAGSSREGSR